MAETLKLKPWSIRIIFLAFALLLLFSSLAAFGVVDLTLQSYNVLAVASAIIIFVEVGLASVFKNKKIDVLSSIGVISALIILITVVFGLMGTTFAVLNGIQGVVFAVLVVSFVIEAMR